MREGADPRWTASLRIVLLYFTVYLHSIGNCGLQVQDRLCLKLKEILSFRRFFDLITVDWGNELIVYLKDEDLTDD